MNPIWYLTIGAGVFVMVIVFFARNEIAKANGFRNEKESRLEKAIERR